jgi:H+/Cl- antiporter ClcA
VAPPLAVVDVVLLQAAASHMGVALCCPHPQHIHIIALFYHLHPLLLLLFLLLGFFLGMGGGAGFGRFLKFEKMVFDR